MTQAVTLPTHPRDVRELIRRRDFTGITAGVSPGYVQANLAILPRDLAFDFLLFCQRNPKPCPIIEVIEAGKVEPAHTAPGADIRTDLPKYRIYRYGELEAEIDDISDYWSDDLVSFLIGCSYSFENAMLDAGIPLRHHEQGSNVSMFITNIDCVPAGMFAGPMVGVHAAHSPLQDRQGGAGHLPLPQYAWSAHPTSASLMPLASKTPPSPTWATRLHSKKAKFPSSGACGVTPQAVAMESKPPLMITHSPGHMFITDLRDEDIAVL